MPTKGGRLKRSVGKRRYKRLFLVAAEGGTEQQYLHKLKGIAGDVHIKHARHPSKSAPYYILMSMKKLIRDNGLKVDDQAWIIVDRDHWPEEKFDELARWASANSKYGLALSNPCFELWLLLHFEDVGGGMSCAKYTRRLKKHIPGYDKNIDSVNITEEMVEDAIVRAKQRDNPRCSGWPRDAGVTTMYKLAEAVLND